MMEQIGYCLAADFGKRFLWLSMPMLGCSIKVGQVQLHSLLP